MLRVLDCSFCLSRVLSYIVIVGNVAGTSLAENQEPLSKEAKLSKQNAGQSMIATGLRSQKMQLLILFMLFCQNPTLVGKNLYAEEKNFDKLAKILNEQLGIDQNEAVQTLEKGLKRRTLASGIR